MNEPAYTLLAVDDDPEYRGLLCDYLRHYGFTLQEAQDGDTMWQRLARYHVDLILLDVMLPGKDGLALLGDVRVQYPQQAVILLSNLGQEEVERIVGLELGADAYLAKSTSLREILAHVKTILRRHPDAHPTQALLSFGVFTLDAEQQCLLKEGNEVSLTAQELSLLRIFLAHPQQTLNREELIRRLKGYEYQPFDRSIDVLVRRLRSKIETDARSPQHIRTIRGKGYMFVA